MLRTDGRTEGQADEVHPYNTLPTLWRGIN